MLNARGDRQREAVGQTLGLGYEGDNVLAESVNAHIEPEAHDILYLLAHLGVIHIEVGLTLGKEMQIILIEILVILPCGTREGRKPVVRRLLAALFAIAPEIIIVIWIILALHALNKPPMLIRGVVYDKIHYDLHAPCVNSLKQLFELIKSAVLLGNVPVIGYVVAHILLGGLI